MSKPTVALLTLGLYVDLSDDKNIEAARKMLHERVDGSINEMLSGDIVDSKTLFGLNQNGETEILAKMVD